MEVWEEIRSDNEKGAKRLVAEYWPYIVPLAMTSRTFTEAVSDPTRFRNDDLSSRQRN